MAKNPVNNLDSANSLSYLNSNQSSNVLWQPALRDPTVNDRRFKLGTIWTNTSTNNSWQLTSVVLNQANWEPLSQSAGGNAPITKYVVDPDGSADYTTIQAAITGIGSVSGTRAAIYIRPADYTENLVFNNNVNYHLVGAVANSDGTAQVNITGAHNLPTSGSLFCRSLKFLSATDAFANAAAGNATLNVDDCQFNLTNGAIFNVPNWTGALTIKNCRDVSTLNSVIDNNLGSSTVNILTSIVGVGTTTMKTQGPLNIIRSEINTAIDMQTGTAARIHHSTLRRNLLASNDASYTISECFLNTQAVPALTHSTSSAGQITNSVIISTNNPAIDGAGAGVLIVGSLDFVSNSSISGSITVTQATTSVGNLTVRGTSSFTGAATFSGAVNVPFVNPTQSSLTFQSSPNTCTAANTGGVATGTTGATNLLTLQNGLIMEQFILGAGQTIIKPVMDANGLLVSLDLTSAEGAEYNFGAARSNSPFAFVVGTSAAFFFQVRMRVADVSGGAPYIIGFRRAQDNDADYTMYNDFYALGINTATSATNVTLTSQLNGGGQTLQDSGDAWTGGDGGTVTLRVNVSAAGVATALIEGSAPSTPLAYTFDSTDVVCPFIRITHGAAAPGSVHLVSMAVGLQ